MGVLGRKIAFVSLFILFLTANSQQRIAKIEFEGNKHVSSWRLRKVLVTPVPTWTMRLFKRLPVADPKSIKKDLENITAVYMDKGYLDVLVKAKPIKYKEREDVVTLVYRVDEGKKYFVERIEWSCTDSIDTIKLAKLIGLSPGDVFSPFKLESGRLNVYRYLADLGYLYAEVEAGYRKVDSLVRIVISVKPGKVVYFGKITYKGLINTKKFLLKRELSIKSGKKYSYSAIQKSRQELFRTGLFKVISIELSDTLSHPDTVDVVIRVIERKRGFYGASIDFGGNKNYDFTMQISANWGHRNVFGNGQSIMMKGLLQAEVITNWQFISNRYEASIYEPWTLGRKIPTNLVLYFEPGLKTKNFPWRVQRFGAELSAIIHDEPRTHKIGATYERVDIYGVPEDIAMEIKMQQGIYITRKITYTIQADVRDNPLNPSEGAFARVNTELVGGLLGGDEHFAKIDATFARYIRLYHDFILASRIRIGVIGRTLPAAEIAPTNKFAAGGANTIRGFKELSVGPKAADGTMLGGNVIFLLSSEIRFPLIWKFYGTVFLDMGQVWDEWKDINPNDIRVSSGFGIAFMTPFGPIRLERGFILTKLDPDQKGRWHIALLYPY